MLTLYRPLDAVGCCGVHGEADITAAGAAAAAAAAAVFMKLEKTYLTCFCAGGDGGSGTAVLKTNDKVYRCCCYRLRDEHPNDDSGEERE